MSRNLDSLLYALRGGDPDMRRSDAAQALGELGDPRALQPLITALQRDKNSLVRDWAAEALGKIGDKRAVEPLITALKDESSSVPIFAAEALGRIGDVQAVEPIIMLLDSHFIDTRTTAMEALAKIGDVRAVKPIVSALCRADSQAEIEIRWGATAALVKIGKPAVESLISALNNSDAKIRAIIAKILGEIGDQRAVEPLVARLENPSSEELIDIVEALSKIGDERALGELERMMHEYRSRSGYYSEKWAIEQAIDKIKQRGQGLGSPLPDKKRNIDYPSSSLWDFVKSTAHTNYLATRLANEIDSWLVADNYLPSTTVVGALETESELIISDDFKEQTKWHEEIIVWPFREATELNEFKNKLNEKLYSFMKTKESRFLSLEYLAGDLFRYEKRTDIMVGRYPWDGYALNPPIERFGKKWYWAEIQGDVSFTLEKVMLEGAIARLRKYYKNALDIDPAEFPNRRRREMRERGGEFVRIMGRLSLMRKFRTLENILDKQPI